MRGEQRFQRRRESYESSAAQAALCLLALFQQLWVQPDAAVDEEHAVVDEPDLHLVGALPEQNAARLLHIRGDAMRAAKVIEGAERQHPEEAALAERRLCHRVDG